MIGSPEQTVLPRSSLYRCDAGADVPGNQRAQFQRLAMTRNKWHPDSNWQIKWYLRNRRKSLKCRSGFLCLKKSNGSCLFPFGFINPHVLDLEMGWKCCRQDRVVITQSIRARIEPEAERTIRREE